MRVALYARVSTNDQTCDNQLLELRHYVEARGWTLHKEYVDAGVSGLKDRRPALDQLVLDAKRRRFDGIVVWKLDRLGRSMRHLVLLLDEFQALGLTFTTLNEGLDTSTPAGRMVAGVIASVAAFERDRLRERVLAGLARARAAGRIGGRHWTHQPPCALPQGLTTRTAATAWGVSKSTAARRMALGQTPPAPSTLSPAFVPNTTGVAVRNAS
jgi:DNA invertase Pin-like site-specific DNA recombinase